MSKIPKTIEEAEEALGALGKLMTAKEWERAAIVYAFTYDGTNQHDSRSTSTTARTPREFADLNITGLKSDRTVRGYRKAWESAMADGAPDIKPGDEFVAPNLPWPPGIIEQYRGIHKSEVVTGFRQMVNEDPKGAIKELIQDSPETMPKLAKGVRTAHPALATMAATPDREEEEERIAVAQPEYVPDYSKDLRYAANAIQRVLIGIRDGKWAPDNTEKTLIAFLAMAFNDITKGESDTTAATVIAEIEDFLQKETQR